MHSDYIKQIVPNPHYSIDFFKTSIVGVGGNLQIIDEYTQQGARLILLHWVAIQCDTNVPAQLMQLQDNFARPLITFRQQIQFTGQYVLNAIINSGKIQLTLTNSNVISAQVRFTVCYQFIQDGIDK